METTNVAVHVGTGSSSGEVEMQRTVTSQPAAQTENVGDNENANPIPAQDWKRVIQVLVVFELVMVAMFASFARYRVYDEEGTATLNVAHYYPLYQDVNVMIYVGFGFLMTFLEHYSFGALGYTLALSSVTVQSSMVTNHLMHCLFLGKWDTLHLDVTNLITSNFAAGAILISFGTVLGRTSALQLLAMAMLETVIYAMNESIGVINLEVVDMGGSIFVHLFGAMFGLAVSYTATDIHRSMQMTDDRKSNKTSDTFAMLGTLFLFMFWPSFNGALAMGSQKHRVMLNTVLSLAASCISALSASVWFENGKLDMVHVQNSVLAGGVAVGSACDLVIQPWAAIIVGFVAGIVSVAGYTMLTPYLEQHFGLMDTCGVLNLHGVPGLMGAVGGAISAWTAVNEEYGTSVTAIWPAREYRTPGEQAGYQVLAAIVTICIASAGGLATGYVMRFLPSREQHYKDNEDWKLD